MFMLSFMHIDTLNNIGLLNFFDFIYFVLSFLEHSLKFSCFFFLIGKGDHFRFGSKIIKKNNQTEIFFLKKKPKPVRIGWFWFFKGKNRFKPVWLGFGSIWLGFFPGFFSLVRFQAYKTDTKPNWSVFSKF